ncbi:MAG: hypothetical protein MRJ65_03810 [Candidatus Brocadiaceae bacterium]|nr:hypothetical protein [Candidatus Brocadiaceae bacterium]
MKIHRRVYFAVTTTFFIGLSLFCSICVHQGQTHAQHAGGGIIDTTKQPPSDNEKLPSFHQSFDLGGGTVPIPWIDEKPTPISIKVTETITYEVPVDEKKFKEKKLRFGDLELKEVKDNAEINFHQVDCYFYNVIKQKQVRSVENLSCERERDGTQYWLSDGRKYVEWGKWSNWKRAKKDHDLEVAKKKP